jgi:membrane protein
VLRRSAQLLWRAGNRFFEHNGPDRAAAIAFYTLLSLLPLLIFLISVGVALLGSFELAYKGALLLFHGVVVPLDQKSLDALHNFVERATLLQWPGILLLAWTARRIFGSLLSALEVVFGAPARGFAHGNLFSLAVVLLTGVALLLTLVASTLFAAIEGALERTANPAALAAFRELVGRFAAHLLPATAAFAFFFLVYRFLPAPQGAGHRARTRRSARCSRRLLWLLAQVAFSYYVRNMADYGLYGALEGVIVLALWLELSAAIILFGGEVVAILPAFGLPSGEPVVDGDRRGGDRRGLGNAPPSSLVS